MLTDEQWKIIAPFFRQHRDKPGRPHKRRGRPFKHSDRAIINGVLWILRTGAQWSELPGKFPSFKTVHRRFQKWVRAGVLERVLHRLASDLKERGKLDLTECSIDGSFASAKKGDSVLVRPSGARVRNSWQLQTALVFLSPSTQAVLPRMKLPSFKQLSREESSTSFPNACLAIEPTTRILSMNS